MEFEWNDKKAAENLRKHGVSLSEASTVFGDPLAVTFFDPDHSEDETRFVTFGISLDQRLLIITHTDRSAKMRIINARLMTPGERKIYEEG